MALKGEVQELIEACEQAGCPVCALTDREMDRYFDHMLYMRVNEIELRADVRAAWGFCNRHASMLIRPAGALGTAIIYEDVLKNLLRALEGAQWEGGSRLRRRSGAEALVARLEPAHECVGCAHQRETERAYVRALVKYLGDEVDVVPDLAAAYGRSDALCWRHLRMALRRVRKPATFELLVAAQRAAWERLGAELAEFIRKNDYRFTHEKMGPEGDSWQRVVRQVAGASGLGGEEDRSL